MPTFPLFPSSYVRPATSHVISRVCTPGIRPLLRTTISCMTLPNQDHQQKGLRPMAQFKADVDTLEAHGYLLQQIAKFYRDLHDRVQTQGTIVLNDFRATGHQDYADQYQLWLDPAAMQRLRDEATTHNAWAQYFFDLANEVRALEGQLGGTGAHGHGSGGPRPS